MAESLVQVTEGSGKKLHTFQRTIGANNVEDEVVIIGEPYLASYTAAFGNIASTTGNDHIIQLMSAASTFLHIRRIHVEVRVATAAGVLGMQIFRLTTAGTGGTAITPQKMDNADGAAASTAMTLPTVKGTEAANPTFTFILPTAAAAPQPLSVWEWNQPLNSKGLIIPTGTAAGVAIKVVTVVAGSTLTGYIEYDEASF